MAKFKKGDRVINLQTDDFYIPHLAKGTVDENNSAIPYVIWEEVKSRAGKVKRWPQTQDRLKREAKPATIEKYKSRGQITFRVKSSNGKVLNHKYNTSQGCDKGIEALKKALSNYKVIDLTK